MKYCSFVGFLLPWEATCFILTDNGKQRYIFDIKYKSTHSSAKLAKLLQAYNCTCQKCWVKCTLAYCYTNKDRLFFKFPCEDDYTNFMTIDHIRPISKGGTDRLSNLQLLCSECNNSKGNQWDKKKN